jgi:parvulin-like peptidyl-prolyl isomerase
MTRAFLPALAVLLLLCSACRKSDERVIARVGKSLITESEFNRKLAEVAPVYRNYVLTPSGRKQFLDVLIREKTVLEAARASGIARSKDYQAQLAELRREEEEKLAEAGEYLMTQLWMEGLRRQGVLKAGDEEIRAFYKDHPSEVQVRHILLPTPAEAEAAKKAVRSGAGSPSARFAAYAGKASLDADTAADGGRMRPMMFGEIIPELEVVFRLKNGEVAGPVASKLGYHVILKEGERPVPFVEAEPRIRIILEKQKFDRHLQSLQSSFTVEVIDAQFK